MGFLQNIFKRSSVPQNYLSRRDVQFVLGAHVNTGGVATSQVRDVKGNTAQYTMKELENGAMTLDMVIARDGQEYRTTLTADTVNEGRTYVVKSLVFDNMPERIDNAREIYRVLNYIGNQIRAIDRKQMPSPHQNKGDLSPFGRFMIRHFSGPAKGGF